MILYSFKKGTAIVTNPLWILFTRSKWFFREPKVFLLQKRSIFGCFIFIVFKKEEENREMWGKKKIEGGKLSLISSSGCLWGRQCLAMLGHVPQENSHRGFVVTVESGTSRATGPFSKRFYIELSTAHCPSIWWTISPCKEPFNHAKSLSVCGSI